MPGGQRVDLGDSPGGIVSRNERVPARSRSRAVATGSAQRTSNGSGAVNRDPRAGAA